jgi:lysozyme family protein
MANFEKAYQKVIRGEGFYANKPNDKGGETYMGISRKYNPDWEGWPLIDDFKDRFGKIKHNKELIITGLEEAVKKRYKEKYWNKMRGDKIVNDGIAISLFDFFINSETGAAKAMQRALQRIGFDIHVDGIIGPMTINAINMAIPVTLNDYFIDERLQHYNDVAMRDHTQVEFLSGWKNRALKFKKLIA